MKQQTFEKHYAGLWQELDEILQQSEQNTFAFWRDKKRDGRLPQLYRRVCHHLSLAQHRRYSRHLVMRLNDLVLRCHQQLYRRHSRFLYQFIHFVLHTFPAEVRRNHKAFWLANAIFYGPALLLFVLVLLQPELIYNLLDHPTVANLESMYDPDAEHIGQDRDTESDMQMFGHYIQNNISIGFQTFATGIFLGLGSIFYMAFNGLFFGGMSGHMVNIGFEHTFFPFVIAHGAFELTAIVIAGQAGLLLGFAIVSPGDHSRLNALKIAGTKALNLLYGVIFLLLLAAFFEAFWSSNSALPLAVKYGVGSFFWLVVLLYLAYCGRPRQVHDKDRG